MPLIGCGRGKYRKPRPSLRTTQERDLLVLQWMDMAKGVARKMWDSQQWIRQRKTLDDVRQDAFHGLIRAAELWDEFRLVDGEPVQFQTYARRVVEKWIYRAAHQSGVIKMPHHIPVRDWPNYGTSLVRSLAGDGDGKLIELPRHEDGDSRDAPDVERLSAALRRLPILMQRILEDRYGLSGEPRQTLADICERYGLKRSMLGKLINGALNRLGRNICRAGRMTNGDRMRRLRFVVLKLKWQGRNAAATAAGRSLKDGMSAI